MKTRYMITDLCYIKHTDEEWEAQCDIEPEDVKEFAGLRVVKNATTKHGDGTYVVMNQEGGVDSGTLALVEIPEDFVVESLQIAFHASNDEMALTIYEKALKQL